MILQHPEMEEPMTDAAPESQHLLALQKHAPDPSRPPLEVYHLSHDLRGPLNSILGFAELLLEEIEGPLNEIQQADITAIYQSARNLLHLINTVVDLSKLEASRINFDFKSVDLKEVIEAVTPDFVAAKPEPLEFVVNLPSTLPAIWADRDRTQQLLKSLLKFAFEFTKKRLITLTAQSTPENVTLRLEIDQAGLSPAEIAELFDLIVHVDTTGRSHLGRGGLDLPLVRHLAEKQQGRAWAESQNSALLICLALPIHNPAT
jgi:signal transduction histidine kinase